MYKLLKRIIDLLIASITLIILSPILIPIIIILKFTGEQEVFYFQKTISANTANSWSGMGIGNQVIPGYYIFVINYADGTVKRGSVTIVQ